MNKKVGVIFIYIFNYIFLGLIRAKLSTENIRPQFN